MDIFYIWQVAADIREVGFFSRGNIDPNANQFPGRPLIFYQVCLQKIILI